MSFSVCLCVCVSSTWDTDLYWDTWASVSDHTVSTVWSVSSSVFKTTETQGTEVFPRSLASIVGLQVGKAVLKRGPEPTKQNIKVPF